MGSGLGGLVAWPSVVKGSFFHKDMWMCKKKGVATHIDGAGERNGVKLTYPCE